MSKKVLSVLLAGLMLSTTIAGCSKGKDKDTSGTTTDIPASASFNGYPMNAKNTTLTWWVGQGFTLNEAYAKPEDSPFHKGLSEMVGVNINWQFPTVGTDAKQAMNLMLASETLPDIIFNDIMTDSERYMNEGVIRDLTKYIQKYSPAYYKFLQSNKTYDKYMKTDSGKYYGYGFFREGGGWNDTYQGPIVRQDWLDALNLQAPKTISEFDKVLKEFKNKYNAVFTAPWSRFKQGGISGTFGSYGSSDLIFYVDGNNKVQLAQAQKEWKDYLAKLNEWWKAGLLDKDLMTNDDAIVRTKVLNGATGLAYSSMGQLSNWENDAKKAGNGAKWVGLQYPKSDDGKLAMVFGGPGIGSVVSAITKSCPDEKLEIAMRVLDYAYTEEGNLYWNYGKEGVSWKKDTNGKPAYTELVTKDPNGLNNAISKYGGSTWSGSCIQATALLYMKNTETAVKANDTWFYPNEAVTSKWKYPSGVSLTAEESTTLNDLTNSITTYVSEMCAKYITGEESLNNFDKFIQQLDKMNLKKILETRQKAYDRYLAR
jgi:putative aldouronate transport system substrate-binding protein